MKYRTIPTYIGSALTIEKHRSREYLQSLFTSPLCHMYKHGLIDQTYMLLELYVHKVSSRYAGTSFYLPKMLPL